MGRHGEKQGDIACVRSTTVAANLTPSATCVGLGHSANGDPCPAALAQEDPMIRRVDNPLRNEIVPIRCRDKPGKKTRRMRR